MKKYTFIFAIAYLIITVALGFLIDSLGLKGGVALNIAATFAACCIAARNFTQEQERAPTIEENQIFAWQGLLATWVISLFLVLVIFAFVVPRSESMALLNIAVSKMFLLIGAVAVAIISVIYYCVIRWSFCWYAKHACKNMG